MNEKQITDLIERMRELGHIYSYQGAKNLIQEYEKLNKPEKVTIPQFVADWLKENDLREETLGEQSVFDVFDSLKNDSKNGYYENVKRWIDENGDLFARAWLDGYTIEEERRYFVKIRATKHYFSRDGKGKIFFSLAYKDSFTKKELEEANFGWVFDCEGIEIEEVKDE